ncbi:MAG: hypothetical protein AAB595_00365 [Patescibacteria group bacterium]
MREEKEIVYFRHLFNEDIDGTSGGILMPQKLQEVFPGFIDPRLLNWGTKATWSTCVKVSEIIKNGKFLDFFESSVFELSQTCLHWGHVVYFCKFHRAKLQTGGLPTLFLIVENGEPVKQDLSNVFVVEVLFGQYGFLEAYLFEFLSDATWVAGCRIVVN